MALRGDLADASPAELLSTFSEQHASGCLAIDKVDRASDTADAATLHLRNGMVYAAALPGGTFLVGTRLVTSHALDADALAEALEAQRSDLSGWRLGEILVHLGHIHADVVEKISTEQVLEIATEVLSWRAGSWRFRSGERTRAMLPHPLPVDDLVRRVQARATEWRELLAAVGGRNAPIVRTAATVSLSSSRELVAMLRAADEHAGDAGLELCAHAAGLSLLEGARLVVSARAAGLLEPLPVEQRLAVGDWPSHPTTSASALALAPKPPATPSTPSYTSYALARLLELDGPARLLATAAAEQAAADAAAGRPTVDATLAQPAPPVEPPVDVSPVEEPAATPEEIAADLEPDTFEDTGHEATVLDLVAARAARSAELAAVEEAATAAALREQLAREQAERDADERAVADALRQAAESRAAASVPAPVEAPAVEPVEVFVDPAIVAPASIEPPRDEPAIIEPLIVEPKVAEPRVAESAIVQPGVIELEIVEPELVEPPSEQPGEALVVEPAEALVVEPTPEPVLELTVTNAFEELAAAASAVEELDAPVEVAAVETPERNDPTERPPAFVTAPAAFTTSPAAQPAPLTAGERLGMFSSSRDPLADTASLLRELSSLGDEDDAPAENRPVSRPPASPSAQHAAAKPQDKKRKGLFGR